MDVRQHYLAEFNAATASIGACLPSITALRDHAFARFLAQGIPTTKDEEWKYTNVSSNLMDAHAFVVPAQTHRLSATQLAPYLIDGASTLVFIDGRYAPDLSTAKTSNAATVCALSSMRQQSAPLSAQWGTVAAAEASAFSALNTALSQDGGYIYVSRDHTCFGVDAPLQLLFVSTEQATPSASYPHNYIQLESGAQAVVVETYAGFGRQPSLTNTVTEVVLGENADLTHYKVQCDANAGGHIGRICVEQHRDSRFRSDLFVLGGALVRNDICTRLNGTGVLSVLNGLYIVGDEQLIDTHTSIDHMQPHGESHEQYKGVLGKGAKGVFNGKVFVRPGAQKTNAKQSNQNILLATDAVMNAKPQLEIFADDVRCTHGATIGQLDDDALFYLRARGLDRQTATQVLTWAFATEMVDRVTVQPLKQQLQAWVLDTLNNRLKTC